jgi:hypothetical protein
MPSGVRRRSRRLPVAVASPDDTACRPWAVPGVRVRPAARRWRFSFPSSTRPALRSAPATNHRGSGITDASPLCRSPGWQPPRHSASTIGRRRAALRSGDRPARSRRTHPQPYALNRSPPEAHRRTGCGARASRPRRPSSEAERRRAGGGRSPLRPSVRVVHHSRSVPVECRQSSAAHEGFGERSRWGAVSTPRYRSALSDNPRADPRSRQAGIC